MHRAESYRLPPYMRLVPYLPYTAVRHIERLARCVGRQELVL
jgi:hypothetical protein